MTKKGPAVIASPCLMWSDDGSSPARRGELDELSATQRLKMRNQQIKAAYQGHNRHSGILRQVRPGGKTA